jgi:hypothetical protein
MLSAYLKRRMLISLNLALIQGVRFGADALYSGENRIGGAMMTAWLNPDSIKVDEKKQKVKVQVYGEDGALIRTYHTQLDTGMNRTYWNMRMDGVRSPSRREVKPDDDLPSGPEVHARYL